MWLYYVFAALAGVASAVEPGQNAGLAKAFGRPLAAGVVSLGISVVCIAAAMAASGQTGLPSLERLAHVPWWAWLGGLLSALLTIAQLFVSKRIGAAPFLGIIVTAGVATSILLDHFGLVGFDTHPLNLWRAVGGGLMIAGVAFVVRF